MRPRYGINNYGVSEPDRRRRLKTAVSGALPAFLVTAFSFCLLALTGCAGESSASPTPTLTPLEALGKAQFTTICVSCHATTPETVIVGPSLAGVAVRAAGRIEGMDARTYIRDSILNPRSYIVKGFPANLMPTNFAEEFSEDEIDALVAYLLTLDRG